MPVDRLNRPEADERGPVARGEDLAQRRDVVMQRARELKRALLESTMRLAPGRAAAAYNEAARKAQRAERSGGSFFRSCVALLIGALSMLIPFPSTCSLQGQLTAAAEAQPVRAMVYAHPSQCAQLDLDELASVSVDGPDSESARFEAQITRLAPHAGSADTPACHIELQLLTDGAARNLPAQAALTVVFATQPRDWLAVVMHKAASDSRLREASTLLRGYTDLAWRQGIAAVAYVTRNPDPRHYWAMLQQLVAQADDDAAER